MSTSPTCIILAGGLGTRLRSAVPDRPKCLAPIGHRTFLEIQMELLAHQGIDQFVLSLGYLAEMVLYEVSRLRSRFAVQTVVEPGLLGTGGAVLLAMKTMGLQEALITNGDTFLGGSLADMMRPLDLAQAELARMAVLDVPDRRRYGGVDLNGERVTGFVEKGRVGPGAINAGLYRLHWSALDSQRPGDVFSLETRILPLLAERDQLGGTRIDGEFTDIGSPDDYFRFCKSHG